MKLLQKIQFPIARLFLKKYFYVIPASNTIFSLNFDNYLLDKYFINLCNTCKELNTLLDETMYHNLPTILLLDKKCDTFRKSSKKLVRLLEKKKIIHYDVYSVIKFINMNFNNIEEWWFNKGLQLARKKFCLKFVKQIYIIVFLSD